MSISEKLECIIKIKKTTEIKSFINSECSPRQFVLSFNFLLFLCAINSVLSGFVLSFKQ